MQREVYEAEQVPVAVFDEFEALVLEVRRPPQLCVVRHFTAPLVVWDLCGAWFSAVGLACSSDPYRSAACPRSDRRLTCRANCIATHLYDEALLLVWDLCGAWSGRVCSNDRARVHQQSLPLRRIVSLIGISTVAPTAPPHLRRRWLPTQWRK
eukprot:jgi/Tetstr1/464797/TSEL_000839.t1